MENVYDIILGIISNGMYYFAYKLWWNKKELYEVHLSLKYICELNDSEFHGNVLSAKNINHKAMTLAFQVCG